MPPLSDPSELLHPAITKDLYVTRPSDVLERAYRIEMQATLRLEDDGSAPSSTHLDISARPTQRTFYDDWDFFMHEVRPTPLREWRYCLAWLHAGAADGSTAVSTLGRTEAAADGAPIERVEVLLRAPSPRAPSGAASRGSAGRTRGSSRACRCRSMRVTCRAGRC